VGIKLAGRTTVATIIGKPATLAALLPGIELTWFTLAARV
jgi:hypothetical protein